MSYYLAIDIGASSGRHMLGHLENGRIVLEEAYRFKNHLVRKHGHLCWDVDALFSQIIRGMQRCAELGKAPACVGIDTWGVDFCLLGSNGRRLGDCVAYRDARTEGMDAVLAGVLDEETLYGRTGIQKQPFNTVYQLLALREQEPALLAKAQGFLLMPEYFSYLLTGRKRHEYTNATTTGLVNAAQRNWDFELIDRLGLPKGLFGEMALPGASLGHLLPDIARQAGFDCEVILPCTHDTASAVVGSPVDKPGSLYLSSGTWSLLGAELDAPICTEESRMLNFTNEGGYLGSYRYLKNIMGLWIVQRIQAEMEGQVTFEDMQALATAACDFPSRIDVNDGSFLSPESMTEAVRHHCKETGQAVPQTNGELFCCVFHSLAESYAASVREIEQMTGKAYSRLCVVGGGSKNRYLNRLTANASGLTVAAGPTEATALGNLLVQMICHGEVEDLRTGRDMIRRSFDIEEYYATTYKGEETR